MYFECYKSSVLIPFWEITNIEMNTENILVSYDNDFLKSKVKEKVIWDSCRIYKGDKM